MMSFLPVFVREELVRQQVCCVAMTTLYYLKEDGLEVNSAEGTIAPSTGVTFAPRGAVMLTNPRRKGSNETELIKVVVIQNESRQL